MPGYGVCSARRRCEAGESSAAGANPRAPGGTTAPAGEGGQFGEPAGAREPSHGRAGEWCASLIVPEIKKVPLQPAVKLLGDAGQRIQCAIKLLDSKTTHDPQPVASSGKVVCILSPVAAKHKSTVSPPCTNKTAYRRTPFPTTRPIQGSTELQFTSTPVFTDSQSLPLLITPCAIHFSESELTACHTRGVESESSVRQQRQTRVSPTEGGQPRSKDNSPGLPEGGNRASQPPEESHITGGLPSRTCPVCVCVCVCV